MNVLIYNAIWMTWNIFLAILGLGFAYIFIKVKDPILKGFFGLLWLLFVPNTVYTLTDLIHIPYQIHRVTTLSRFVWGLQYVLLVGIGIYTYLKSMQWIEGEIRLWLRRYRKQIRYNQERIVIGIMTLMNFLIAFGVAMGRVQRTNSWQVLTDPIQVFQDTIATVSSSQQVIFVLLFGVGIHCLYLGLARKVA